jgi:hypothetical protein
MTQQAEMRSDAPSPIDWTHKIQELIKLLVEAVLMLPDNERRRGGLSVDILFEALLTLQKGLRNWFDLDSADRERISGLWLSPLDRWCNQEAPAVAPGSLEVAAELKETSNVA